MQKRIVKRRWLSGVDAYVEVRLLSKFSTDGLSKLDIYRFVRDPRKAQHRKSKYWNRGGSHHRLTAPDLSDCVNGGLLDGMLLFEPNPFYSAAQNIIDEISLTSSVGRALVS